jgi:hypothetical protein
LQREARREIQLLLNESGITESDFYVYRYLANEGFLPGYNFPRLPVRALVTTGNQSQAIDRARFIGLTEFGPGNTLYHEGRKHRIASVVLPAGGIEGRLIRAKLCNNCGNVHPRDDAEVDLCVHCGTRLDGATSQFPQALFEQPTVRARRWTRITSEEEERVREGYVTSTHFRGPRGTPAQRRSLLAPDTQAVLLSVLYLPQAQLWRINHGWRKASEQAGFVIDSRGQWRSREDTDSDTEIGPNGATLMAGLKPFVTDSRNILLLRPQTDGPIDEAFLKSLAHALRRALQVEYQIEEREIAIELIGREDNQNPLFWEAAEGGIGVWERLIADPREVQQLARRALELLHFDPENGEEQPEWSQICRAACYDCLLSYSNQSDHRHLDRHKVRDFLFALSRCEAAPVTNDAGYGEQYVRLLNLIDPGSTLERNFLRHLHENDIRLPDHAQHTPAHGTAVQPDFYFERDGIPGICVFVDGPHHDDPKQVERDSRVREALKDQGFRVIAIRWDRPFADKLAENPDVFQHR